MIDLTDTSLDLLRHVPSGDVYVTRHASVWQDDHCTGSAIIAIAGPLHYTDWQSVTEDAEWYATPRANWPDSVKFALKTGTSYVDLDWANDQEWSQIASTV